MTMRSRNAKRIVGKTKFYEFVATTLKVTLIFSALRTTICSEEEKLTIKPFPTKLETGKQADSLPISNLNKYLLGLDPSCLIHITNYQNGNFPPFATPVFLQQMKPGIVESIDKKTSSNLIISVPAELKLPAEVEKYSWNAYCPTSYFLSGCAFPSCSSICGELDFGYFLTNSKPWRCEATIALFPPDHLFLTERERKRKRNQDETLKLVDLRMYSSMFNTNFRTRTYGMNTGLTKTIPSYQPINILVLRDSDVKSEGKLKKNLDEKLKFWMDYLLMSARFRKKGTDLVRNTFYLFLTKQVDGNSEEIGGSHLLSIGKSRSGMNPKVELVASNSLVKGINSGSYFDMDGVLSQISFTRGNKMAFCNFMYDRIPLFKANNDIGLVAAYSKVWATIILSNMSVVIGSAGACNPITSQLFPLLHKIPKTSVVSLEAYNLVAREYSPIKIEDTAQSLGIISCGQPTFSPITVTPLFSIFDYRIWFCIFITFFVIAPIAAYGVESQSKKMRKTISKNRKRCQAVLNHLCLSLLILLKQGAPRLMTRTKFPGLKFVAGSILLIGLVISNAYLYPDNLRHLVGPRHIIRPWYYHDLIWENYQIFTRANVESIIDSSKIDTFKQTSEHSATFNSFVGYTIPSKLSSEVSLAAESDPYARYDYYGPGRGLQAMLQHSSLHPDLFKEDVTKLGKIEIDQEKFRAIEKSILLKELLECRRVALVLPFQEMYEYYTEIRWRLYSSISVLPQTLHRKEIGIHLSGWVSDNIIWRIRAMDSTGIWSWVKGRFGFDKERKLGGSRYHRYVTAASMSGNIIVVFLLLAFGVLMGAISFFVEKMIQLGKYLCCGGKKKKATETIEIESILVEEKKVVDATRQVENEEGNESPSSKSEVSSLASAQGASTCTTSATSPIQQELESRPPVNVTRLRKDVDEDEIIAVEDVEYLERVEIMNEEVEVEGQQDKPCTTVQQAKVVDELTGVIIGDGELKEQPIAKENEEAQVSKIESETVGQLKLEKTMSEQLDEEFFIM
ncbi:unnamed protein product [Orchesella dallaii]|uniref:Uncharacterized protein n=1 Tax=Orchesella dallaii TaxID=48710 RepID=A0ABP1Q077_9HEXA